MQDVDLLKAIMAVAVADGELMRAEKGVIEGLAARVGIGPVTFDAMMQAAREDENFVDDLALHSATRARSALKLLVATARIDGHISDEERRVIVRVAGGLGITGDEFEKAYLEGIADADALRRSRKAQKS